ncbi:hypothetical protein ABZX12_41385 [Kribbella sp. NPDC003505]|uniref:hypothetical protein n=1 Tax=Kribbella sp. NPDC003505 TaxID=3154448 RepID=UPI0033B8E962
MSEYDEYFSHRLDALRKDALERGISNAENWAFNHVHNELSLEDQLDQIEASVFDAPAADAMDKAFSGTESARGAVANSAKSAEISVRPARVVRRTTENQRGE